MKYVPPVHPGEVILCGILKEMLGLPQVSVEADLIDDLGLTSLDMLRLVTEANKKDVPSTYLQFILPVICADYCSFRGKNLSIGTGSKT